MGDGIARLDGDQNGKKAEKESWSAVQGTGSVGGDSARADLWPEVDFALIHADAANIAQDQTGTAADPGSVLGGKVGQSDVTINTYSVSLFGTTLSVSYVFAHAWNAGPSWTVEMR
jgi:hypothetical protein